MNKKKLKPMQKEVSATSEESTQSGSTILLLAIAPSKIIIYNHYHVHDEKKNFLWEINAGWHKSYKSKLHNIKKSGNDVVIY